ncbi:hypothetical protein LPY66_15935 [Dehalobacter sp. DCM]|uniref:hypothetical protein n=1 Tax=Dehalobacter sp. DCM TaxID=2907827 RepID=UPI003081A008|nr:hypothetical protein LPY66_15935 [Dehalobacter sp. DCM]
MNYQEIASQVNQFVKDPQKFMSEKSKRELIEKEIRMINNTPQFKVSGNGTLAGSVELTAWM